MFSQKLLESIRRNGSLNRRVWKYILLKNTDKDEHIFRAVEIANGIGIEIAFVFKAGKLVSIRPLSEI